MVKAQKFGNISISNRGKIKKKTSARLDPREIWDVRLPRRFLNIYKRNPVQFI